MTEVAVYNVTAVDVAKQFAAYRTVRFGAVSIREVAGPSVKYSVRAPVSARRLPSGGYQCGQRTTVIYDDQSDVAAVVNAQHHIRQALPARTRQALPARSTRQRAISAPRRASRPAQTYGRRVAQAVHERDARDIAALKHGQWNANPDTWFRAADSRIWQDDNGNHVPTAVVSAQLGSDIRKPLF